jgi:hypothetical protein
MQATRIGPETVSIAGRGRVKTSILVDQESHAAGRLVGAKRELLSKRGK